MAWVLTGTAGGAVPAPSGGTAQSRQSTGDLAGDQRQRRKKVEKGESDCESGGLGGAIVKRSPEQDDEPNSAWRGPRRVHPAGFRMSDDDSLANARSEPRNARELATCLLELSRLVRGVGFYPAEDRERARLIDRAHLALGSELDRHGRLQLRLKKQRLRVDGLEEPLTDAHIDSLAKAFEAQGIAAVFLAPGLERDAVEGLAMLLAQDPTGLDACAAFEPWSGLGIDLVVEKPGPTQVDFDAPVGAAPPVAMESDFEDELEAHLADGPTAAAQPDPEPASDRNEVVRELVASAAESEDSSARAPIDESSKSIDEDPICLLYTSPSPRDPE